MTNLTDNASIRRRAWDLTRQNFGVLILMTLLVALIPAAAGGILTALTVQVTSASTGLGIALLVLCSLLIILVSVGLALGYQNAVLRLIRGNEISVGDVFSRMNCSWKGFLLALFIGLRVYLWALPGIAVIALGALFGEDVFLFFAIVGLIVVYVCIIMAAFRYCMSTIALADQPELGVLGAFNKSKEIMNGRKWQYFKLIFVIFLILIAISLVLGVVTGLAYQARVLVILLAVASIVIDALVGLVIEVASLIFYNQLVGGPSGDEASPEKEAENNLYQY